MRIQPITTILLLLLAPLVSRAATPAASQSEQSRQVYFESDIEPILSRHGCNTASCHGKAEGQKGFKLSVFGFDPGADYQALAVEGRGRRVFPANPPKSLILQKPAGEVPHGGGVRFRRGSPEYETLRRWIAEGLRPPSEDDPTVVRIELTPNERVAAMGSQQQLTVVAQFSDGRREDVTRLAKFQSNSDTLLSVDQHGLVKVADTPGQAAVMATFLGAVDVYRVLIPSAKPIADYPQLDEVNFIDTLVHRQLKKLGILPSQPAGDAEFLRRAHLDIIGTLPTAQEARSFLSDKRSDKRARLVDALLDRPEYADYWALRWADQLRVERRVLGHKGAYTYYKWIRDSVAQNKPLDAMARELIAAEGPLAESPQANFYKVVTKPGDMASTLSQVFLGVRIDCAQCHHHPFDRWSQRDYYGMQAFFQQVRRKTGSQGEMLYAEGNPQTKHPRTGAPIFAYALGDEMPEASPEGDRRQELARRLTSPENRWFARNLANRIFAHFTGRGVVEPVDDVRDTNPPSNPELLDALARHLVEQRFDAKALIRTITASAAYQRSSQPNATNERDEQNYSRALWRRMPAEVLLDAVLQTTGTDEKFIGLPQGVRAIQLWDNQSPHYFLKLFGRPVRVTACTCERNAEPTIGQVLHLMNSPKIEGRLSHDAGLIARLVREHAADEPLCEALYLTFFSRLPTDAERAAALAHFQASASRRQAAEDLAWSLLNTLEFVFIR